MAGRPPPPSHFNSFPSLPTSTWAQIARTPQPRPAVATSSSTGAAAALAAGAAAVLDARARPAGAAEVAARARSGRGCGRGCAGGCTRCGSRGRPGRTRFRRCRHLRQGCYRRRRGWPRHASGRGCLARGAGRGREGSAQGAGPRSGRMHGCGCSGSRLRPPSPPRLRRPRLIVLTPPSSPLSSLLVLRLRRAEPACVRPPSLGSTSEMRPMPWPARSPKRSSSSASLPRPTSGPRPRDRPVPA